MLYFFYGKDTEKARARARGVISAMKKKRPEAEYFRVTSDTWNPAMFEEFISGQGLFERKSIVFADGALERAEAKVWVTGHLKEIAASENAFVFLERTADAETRKKFEKIAQECKEFPLEETAVPASRTEFNVFSMTDALGQRERARLWSLMSEALMRDVTPEEINGVLFWQVKSMLAASLSKSAANAGLKPFVFEKSRRYAARFRPGELAALSRALVSLYHDAHRGVHEFSAGLERLSLSL